MYPIAAPLESEGGGGGGGIKGWKMGGVREGGRAERTANQLHEPSRGGALIMLCVVVVRLQASV